MNFSKINITISRHKEKTKHKLKRLIPSPNSFFMDVKCPGCLHDNVIFSHSQISIYCKKCNTIMCRPTGGKAMLMEGSSFCRKRKKRRLCLTETY
nr:40S ribosomal protein S27 [Cryptomonas paramecium]